MTILGTLKNSSVITVYLSEEDALRLIQRLQEMLDKPLQHDYEAFNAEVSVSRTIPTKEVNFSIGEP